jgi:cytochrome b involved in lipid metabolism
MNIKKELVFGVISIVVIAAAAGFFVFQFNQKEKQVNQALTNIQKNNQNPNQKQNSTNNQPVTLTVEEVQKHNQRNDCWLIINDAVYDVTNYAQFHPGGDQRIYRFCGQDATKGFQTKGGKGSHSQRAVDQLKQLYLGKIGETVNLSK